MALDEVSKKKKNGKIEENVRNDGAEGGSGCGLQRSDMREDDGHERRQEA
jgi:hypothetical protein